MDMYLLTELSFSAMAECHFLNIHFIQPQGKFLTTKDLLFVLYFVCSVMNFQNKRLENHLVKLFQKSSMYTNCSLARAEISLEVKFGF